MEGFVSMSSFEQFLDVLSSSQIGVDFGRENVAMKHLTRVKD
jgi:hypothetical protein